MLQRRANLMSLFISIALYILLIGALLTLAGENIISILQF
jgi:hypothetical protein